VQLDPDATETAALAHDIGHPPFGHAIELELRRLLDDVVAPAASKATRSRSESLPRTRSWMGASLD
jgi:HD superfamily phosphohydrolase